MVVVVAVVGAGDGSGVSLPLAGVTRSGCQRGSEDGGRCERRDRYFLFSGPILMFRYATTVPWP